MIMITSDSSNTYASIITWQLLLDEGGFLKEFEVPLSVLRIQMSTKGREYQILP